MTVEKAKITQENRDWVYIFALVRIFHILDVTIAGWANIRVGCIRRWCNFDVCQAKNPAVVNQVGFIPGRIRSAHKLDQLLKSR